MLSNIDNDMSVIVIGYDGYSDLWENYFELLDKNWDDRSFPVYLANNTKISKFNNVNTINCGEDAEWSKKTRIAVENVKSPYICLMLEDFFIGSKIDNQEIINTKEFIKKEKIKYYKVNNFSKLNTKKYGNIDYLYTIPENLEYGISLQPAIWERTFLLQLLGKENYNAWVFEYDRIIESEKKSNEIMQGCVYDDRNIFNIQHGVVQGKYLPKVIKYFDNKNYYFDTNYRAIMSSKELFYYKIKGVGKLLVHPMHRNTVKQYLGKTGMKFISDKAKK